MRDVFRVNEDCRTALFYHQVLPARTLSGGRPGVSSGEIYHLKGLILRKKSVKIQGKIQETAIRIPPLTHPGRSFPSRHPSPEALRQLP